MGTDLTHSPFPPRPAHDEYAHRVEAINADFTILILGLMTPQGVVHGLARIDKLTVSTDDETEVPRVAALSGFACVAHYRIGPREFTIPLGSNLGTPVSIGPAN